MITERWSRIDDLWRHIVITDDTSYVYGKEVPSSNPKLVIEDIVETMCGTEHEKRSF